MPGSNSRPNVSEGYEVPLSYRGDRPTREINICLSAFAPENLVSRDRFGNPIPRQPAHRHTQVESGAYLRDSSRVPRRRPSIYLKPPYAIGPVPSFRVTQMRTDGVHCRESAGTGTVNLEVVPNKCCLGLAGHHGPINIRPFFLHPLNSK